MTDHGKRSTYVAGCRCEPCTTANRKYAQKFSMRQAQIRHGAIQDPMVDAEIARQHIKALQASGMGRRQIAKMAGVSDTVIMRLFGWDKSRPCKRLTREIHEKLIAVRPGGLAGGAHVDSLGTARRLQALVTIGYSQHDLAEYLGYSRVTLSYLVNRKFKQVTVSTATEVATMYERLCMVPSTSQRSRNHAAKKKWLPPLAWDNIDDPGENPKENLRSKHESAYYSAVELIEMGLTSEAIAQRLKIGVKTVDRYRDRSKKRQAA